MTTYTATYGHKTLLKTLFEECIAECDAIGIPYKTIEEVSENTRATSRWGLCRKNPLAGTYSIQVSTRLLADGVDRKSAKTTLLHEICHTVKFEDGHRGEWLRCANALNRAYGYNIKRTSSAEEKGVEEEPRPVRRYTCTYSIKCVDCGHVYTRQKMSKAIQHPEWYACSRCHGKLIRV